MIKTLKRIGIKAAIYKLISRIKHGDSEIISACDRIGAYRYLDRKYRPVLDRVFPKTNSEDKHTTKKIWVCWLQGYDNAPYLVKRCIDSIKAHSSGLEVILLDESNIEQYVSIPQYIAEKHAKGIIPSAHYADCIRIALLARHGGIWIDSTVWLTDDLPRRIIEADLFCFKIKPIGKVYASNWFIASSAQHPFIVQMQTLLYEYWARENRLVSYSIFHLFWTMIITHSNENKKLWDSVPYFDDINCKILQTEMFLPYSELRYNDIKAISPIHKLTYKFLTQEAELPNTFYRNIFNNQ